MKTWLSILVVYVILLISIGYVAFSKQYFNDADDIAGQFLDLREKYSLDSKQLDVLNELMKQSADSAGDLQELATQSFNITLGGLLAFLSASATFFSQKSKNSAGVKVKHQALHTE